MKTIFLATIAALAITPTFAGNVPTMGEMFAPAKVGTLQLGVASGQAEPLQMDAQRRLLVVCHEGNRVGDGTATMETVGGRNMLVAKCGMSDMSIPYGARVEWLTPAGSASIEVSGQPSREIAQIAP